MWAVGNSIQFRKAANPDKGSDDSAVAGRSSTVAAVDNCNSSVSGSKFSGNFSCDTHPINIPISTSQVLNLDQVSLEGGGLSFAGGLDGGLGGGGFLTLDIGSGASGFEPGSEGGFGSSFRGFGGGVAGSIVVCDSSVPLQKLSTTACSFTDDISGRL